MEPTENKYGDSSTEDEAGSQTTEDEVPERQAPLAAAPPPPPPVPAPSTVRDRPHYELRHTLSGHSSSISAVKFSPDGTLLASCGMSTRSPLPRFWREGLSICASSSERQSREDLVSIHRRTDTKLEWTHEGPVGYRLVVGQCQPRICF